jgi:hypothetical protein
MLDPTGADVAIAMLGGEDENLGFGHKLIVAKCLRADKKALGGTGLFIVIVKCIIFYVFDRPAPTLIPIQYKSPSPSPSIVSEVLGSDNFICIVKYLRNFTQTTKDQSGQPVFNQQLNVTLVVVFPVPGFG